MSSPENESVQLVLSILEDLEQVDPQYNPDYLDAFLLAKESQKTYVDEETGEWNLL
jgi:hypothetical protein